ncbi:hypothetical protein CALVIDRAFT_491636, partial [Calocera viscosa TUFC12733]
MRALPGTSAASPQLPRRSSVVDNLSINDQRCFKAFKAKTEAHLSISQYDTLHKHFPQSFPPLSEVQRRVKALSEVKAVSYDCCVNSCMAYTGLLADLQQCPHCNEPRLKEGKPRKQYQYLRLIPQLKAQYGNKKRAVLLTSYRAGQDVDAEEMSDIFQGKLYRELCQRYIEVNGETLATKYFDSPRDIALGLSTDGFAPFKGRRTT